MHHNTMPSNMAAGVISHQSQGNGDNWEIGSRGPQLDPATAI